MSWLCRISKLANAITPVVLPSSLNVSQVRLTSFFTKHTAEQLWKGVTSVSNAGRKRGRGKGAGKKMIRDLNKGQIIGVGKVNMVWPGLTTSVLRGKELVQQQRLPEDPDREAKLIKLRNNMGMFRRLKLAPTERGWSGSRLPGRKVGPPDPVGEEVFEGFETVCLESKSVFNMTGNLGRKRQMSMFVVTGNGNGLAGFGIGKAIDGKAALKSAKNRAGQRLMYIERYNDHTVCHDFFTQFGFTKIYVKQKPEGHGLVCHRAIKSMCEVIGIKDIYCKVEGSTNIQSLTKAFFLGLLQQKLPEQLAEETGYHLVEFRSDTGNVPKVVASPVNAKSDAKNIPTYDEYVMGNRVVLKKKKYPPFYVKHDPIGYMKHLKKTLRYRNMEDVKIKLKTASKYLNIQPAASQVAESLSQTPT
uniref:Small ribosomal subunit protein uS5m n=1 Tax=Lygus hesperus TaxID=30085 RepID=A0A146KTA7_LYGHE